MALKQVYIVPAWGEDPESGWTAWLVQELQNRGIQAKALYMPDPESPRIEAWVASLSNAMVSPGLETGLVGHSIGCQTILRYLQQAGIKMGRVALVAPWLELTESALTADEQLIAEPWLSQPIKFQEVCRMAEHFTAIFSDNDPLVPLENASIFREHLYAEIIIEENKGHFTSEDGVEELPVVLDALMDGSLVL